MTLSALIPPGLHGAELAVLLVVTTFAAVVQRLSGMGFGTLLAPVAAIVAVDYVPGAILLIGLTISLAGLSMDLRREQLREIAPALAGRLFGTVPAVLLVGWLTGGPGMDVFIGLTILVGVALGAAGLTLAKTPLTLFGAGWLSGFLATISSVGAAPMALIYQNDKARAARGGLNAFFFIGLLFAIAGLAMRGLIEARHLALALWLTPGVALGIGLSLPLARFVDGGALKPYALSLSSLAALALLGRAIF